MILKGGIHEVIEDHSWRDQQPVDDGKDRLMHLTKMSHELLEKRFAYS
jgi:hypothetical protein